MKPLQWGTHSHILQPSMSRDCSPEILITWGTGSAEYFHISRPTIPVHSPLDLYPCFLGVQMSSNIKVNFLHQLVLHLVRNKQLQVSHFLTFSKILTVDYSIFQLKIVPLGTIGFGGRVVRF